MAGYIFMALILLLCKIVAQHSCGQNKPSLNPLVSQGGNEEEVGNFLHSNTIEYITIKANPE
jgi:hypothetical protein